MPRSLLASVLVALLVVTGSPGGVRGAEPVAALPLEVPAGARPFRATAVEFRLPKRVAALDGRIFFDSAAAEVAGLAPVGPGSALPPMEIPGGVAFGAYGLKASGGHTIMRVVVVPLKAGRLELRVVIDSAADQNGKRLNVKKTRGAGRMAVAGSSRVLAAPQESGRPLPSRVAGAVSGLEGKPRIGKQDLDVVRAGWEMARLNDAACGPDADAEMDANGDGCVDVVDVQAVLAAQGQRNTDAFTLTAPGPTAGGFVTLASAGPTFVVDSTADTPDAAPDDGLCADVLGNCTLRAAITASNWWPGPNRIEFDLPGTAPVRIQLSATIMPVINRDGLTIDGYSQPGSSPNTLEYGTNAVPGVEIRGTANSPRGTAFRVTSADNTIRGLILNNLFRPIVLDFPSSANNRILGNWVGFDPDGSTASHSGDYQILIQGGAHHNIIGTPDLADRNVSGRGRKGVELWGAGTDSNVIQNNLLCTAPDGSTASCLGGVDMDHGPKDNLVGGTGPFEYNVTGRTSLNGVEMSHGFSPAEEGPGTDPTDTWQINDNRIIGNWVGFRPDGSYDPAYRVAQNNPGAADNGNGINAYDGSNRNLIEGNYISAVWDGIQTMSSNTTGTIIRNNIIGESPLGEPAPLTRWGIVARLNTLTHLIEGNIIKNTPAGGIGLTQQDVRFVRLTRNVVMDTTGPAIFLAPNPGNPTIGANNLLAAPVVTSATTFEVSGTGINGATVEVYRADRPAGESGLPIEYLGSAVVASGTWSVPVTSAEGERVTALQHTPNGNTSPVGVNVAATTAPLPDAPVAGFDWAQEAGTLAVDFTDTSTGSPTTWSWDFGDGNSSTDPDPSHTYAAAGDYTVVLTASNAGGTDDETRTVTVDEVVPPPDGTLAEDTFGRTSSDGWGSADFGGAYTLQGNAGNFDVADGLGTIELPVAGANRSALLDDVSALDVDVSFRVAADTVASGSPYYVYAVTRRVGGNAYRPKIILNTNGSVSVHAGRVVSNGESSVAPSVVVPGLTQTAGGFIWVRAEVTGTSPTTIRVKAWADGQPEPSGWHFEATDSTAALQTAGGVGVRVYLGGAVNNAPVLFTFDDFAAVDPT